MEGPSGDRVRCETCTTQGESRISRQIEGRARRHTTGLGLGAPDLDEGASRAGDEPAWISTRRCLYDGTGTGRHLGATGESKTHRALSLAAPPTPACPGNPS